MLIEKIIFQVNKADHSVVNCLQEALNKNKVYIYQYFSNEIFLRKCWPQSTTL